MTSIIDSADAQVRYNPSVTADKTTNYGSASSADVSRATTADHNATYLKFSLAGQNMSNVNRAILEITGQNTANSSTALIEVYGILNNSWSESTLDYANAPDISSTDSRMINVGTDAFPVGHLSFNGTLGTSMLDVTSFVEKYAASSMSFVLVREQQYSAEADDGDLVSISTRESGVNAPQLMLMSVPEPGMMMGAAFGNALAVAAGIQQNIARPIGPSHPCGGLNNHPSWQRLAARIATSSRYQSSPCDNSISSAFTASLIFFGFAASPRSE